MNKIIFLAAFFVLNNSAFAYIGPGVGAGLIATVLGIFLAFILAIIGLLYYPIKRFIKGKKNRKN